jgi:mitochondrial fission protein ELM1
MTASDTPAGRTVRARIDEAVWVLDDPRAGTSGQAVGLAERLGVPFRRIGLSWNWLAHVAALSPRGSLIGLAPNEAIRPPPDLADGRRPLLTVSAGARSAPVALWLKEKFGSHAVHCMRPGLRAGAFDLLVIPRHDPQPRGAATIRIQGVLHRASPFALAQARSRWAERLAHMPRPRVAVLVGGPVRGTELPPALAHRLGRKVAQLALREGGSVLATTSRRTGAEATEAFAAGLSPAMNLLYRWGEPGENPYLGFLALADAIVVTADSISMVSEACATAAPVFLAAPKLAGARHRRLMDSLFAAGAARPLGNDLTPWPRRPIDEAGRVAAEIVRLFPLE